ARAAAIAAAQIDKMGAVAAATAAAEALRGNAAGVGAKGFNVPASADHHIAALAAGATAAAAAVKGAAVAAIAAVARLAQSKNSGRIIRVIRDGPESGHRHIAAVTSCATGIAIATGAAAFAADIVATFALRVDAI